MNLFRNLCKSSNSANVESNTKVDSLKKVGKVVSFHLSEDSSSEPSNTGSPSEEPTIKPAVPVTSKPPTSFKAKPSFKAVAHAIIAVSPSDTPITEPTSGPTRPRCVAKPIENNNKSPENKPASFQAVTHAISWATSPKTVGIAEPIENDNKSPENKPITKPSLKAVTHAIIAVSSSDTPQTGPELRGRDFTLSKIVQPTNELNRRTKIVCTLGPACWKVPQLEKLIDAGMTVARFNFSHGDHEGHKACLDRLREAAANKNAHIGVMLDTKGPEIRSGFFANDANKIDLIKNETIILTTDYDFKGDNTKLACSYPALATSVTPGQSILVADGSLVLTVLSCNEAAGEVSCRIGNNASIGERKNMNLPGVVVDLPTLTEKDINDIANFGCANDVDFIAASFVRKASDVTLIRQVLADNGAPHIKIICKIENLEGLQNYDAILEETDAIMVARGDLGMEIPPEKVFLAQKMMIRAANVVGKPVITATQMLESMITNPRPTRAECSDVANAVLDGTDCVMLSGETANGEHSEAAVTIMARICCEAESAINFNSLYEAVRNSTLRNIGTLSTSESIASSAVKSAIDVGAKAIIVCSQSGVTAQQVAKFRPGMTVIVLTTIKHTARLCNGLFKGCTSKVLNSINDTDRILEETVAEFRSSGLATAGAPIVVVTGTNLLEGSTNTMKIMDVLFDWRRTELKPAA